MSARAVAVIRPVPISSQASVPSDPVRQRRLDAYRELRRGWVNTAALLGSGSLIRYESVPEALRPLGGEVARVSAWSRGERSRPACGPLSEWRAAQRR